MAKESIASTLPAPKGGHLDISQFFGGTVPAVTIAPREVVPYVSFAHPQRRDEWAKLKLMWPTLEEGDQVLIDGEPKQRLQPMKFSLIAAKQYFTAEDQAGNILQTFLVDTKGTRERIVCALVLYLADRAIVCTTVPKTTKCAAFQAASLQLELSTKAETAKQWMEQSEGHKLAVATAAKMFGPGPDAAFARFSCTVGLGHRTGKQSGLPYSYTTASIVPTGAQEWKQLSELAGAEAGISDIRKCIEHWRSICDFTESKIKK